METKYLIYTTAIEAETKQSKVTSDCNFDDGVTTRYADVLKHPTLDQWALIVHPMYLQYFTQIEIDSSVVLSSDWFLLY